MEKIKTLILIKLIKIYQIQIYFWVLKSVSLDFIEKKYGLDDEGIIEYTIYMSDNLKSASMYAIFKIEDNSIEEKIDEKFMDKYVFSWTNVVYDEDEAYLVNNMYKERYGDYVIYIISKDNDKALEVIKG